MSRLYPSLLLSFFIILAACANPDNPQQENQDNFLLPQPLEGDTLEEFDMPPIGLQAPIPNCDAKIAVVTEMRVGKRAEQKDIVVQVCELPLDFKRVPLGIMIRNQRLAQGSSWIKAQEGDDWHVIEYRVFKIKKYFAELNVQKEREVVLEHSLVVFAEGVPFLIRELPRDIKEEIIGFIAYPNGGFEIFLLQNNETVAQRVLRAVNIVLKKNKLNP